MRTFVLVGVSCTLFTSGLMSSCVVQILQRVPNNYETDLIYPIVAAAAKLAGLDYKTADVCQQTSLKVRRTSELCTLLARIKVEMR